MQEKRTLNDKIEEFNKYMDWFYSDEFKLEEAVDKYKDAAKLACEIEKDLDELKNEAYNLPDHDKRLSNI